MRRYVGALALVAMIGMAGWGFSLDAAKCTAATQDCLNYMTRSLESRGWVGIEVDDESDIARLIVSTVVKDSPADKADLRGSSQSKTMDDIEHIIGGDIIVSIDGNEVRKIDDILIHLQREKSVGDETELGIIRDNTESTITVILGDRPPSS